MPLWLFFRLAVKRKPRNSAAIPSVPFSGQTKKLLSVAECSVNQQLLKFESTIIYFLFKTRNPQSYPHSTPCTPVSFYILHPCDGGYLGGVFIAAAGEVDKEQVLRAVFFSELAG